jgi:hypothetical protein
VALEAQVRGHNTDTVLMSECGRQTREKMVLRPNWDGWTNPHVTLAMMPTTWRSKSGRKMLVIFLTLILTNLLRAQSPITDVLTARLGDVAVLKQNAEAGNADAQVKLGNLLASRFRQSEALDWYRKAAAQGNIDAEFHVGHMLLFGAFGDTTNSVKPNRSEGLRWTFIAATNLHSGACDNMNKALQQGCGTNPDPVAAYAWLLILSETPGGVYLARSEMNDLALKLDTESIRRARNIAAEWKAGHWQAPVAQIVPNVDLGLRLGGVVFGRTNSQAVINGRTMQEGESATIKLKSGTLIVRCLKIRSDSVLVSLDGEDQPRVLQVAR